MRARTLSNGISAVLLQASRRQSFVVLQSCGIDQDYVLLFGCGVEEVTRHSEKLNLIGPICPD